MTIRDGNRVSEVDDAEDGDSDDSADQIENSTRDSSETRPVDIDLAHGDMIPTQDGTQPIFGDQHDDQQLNAAAANLNPDLFDLGQLLNTSLAQSTGRTKFANNNAFASLLNQKPLTFSFNQMGPAAYADITEKGSLLVQGPYGQLRRTNSLFSDHVTVVEYFLRQKWINVGALMNHGDECLAQSVSFMLSAFVCMSWQMMTAWHSYTRAHIPVGKLMTWHLNPTVEAFVSTPKSI